MIRNPAVQAVWICSPSQFHAQQIRLAAELGKDIFCEKPVATELGETIEAGAPSTLSFFLVSFPTPEGTYQ